MNFSITYPAISAFVSMHSDADKQGLVQGMITGVRGLCNGLGPAMFGLIFSLFHVDLNEKAAHEMEVTEEVKPPKLPGLANLTQQQLDEREADMVTHIVPGPPFVFGSLLVLLALIVAAFIPDNIGQLGTSSSRRASGAASAEHHESGGGATSLRRYSSGSAKKKLKKGKVGGGARPGSVTSSLGGGSEDGGMKRVSLSMDYRLNKSDDDDMEFTVPLIHTEGGANSRSSPL